MIQACGPGKTLDFIPHDGSYGGSEQRSHMLGCRFRKDCPGCREENSYREAWRQEGQLER